MGRLRGPRKIETISNEVATTDQQRSVFFTQRCTVTAFYLREVYIHYLMKKPERKKISCHYKLSQYHRTKLKRLAKDGRRTMTSIVEQLIESAEVGELAK